jgi:hypothetical protein
MSERYPIATPLQTMAGPEKFGRRRVLFAPVIAEESAPAHNEFNGEA